MLLWEIVLVSSFTWLGFAVVRAENEQVLLPLQSSSSASEHVIAMSSPWDDPHPDSTSNLIFNTASSLLQRRPNNMWGNGLFLELVFTITALTQK
jgi:hypothetical protein